MKTSADNQFYGKVSQITMGAVNAEISLQISADIELVSIITNHSAIRLKLEVGQYAFALIKANDPLIFIESTPENYSARNILWGSIFAIEQGAVNCEVLIDLGNEQQLNVIITGNSALALKLTTGMRIGTLIKASQVMLATASEHNA